MAYNKTMLNMDEQQLRKALVYDAVQEHRTEQNFHVFEDGQFNYVDARHGFGLSSAFVEQVAQVHNGERNERDGRLMYRFPSRDDASNFVHNIGLLNERYTNLLRDILIEKMRKAGIDVNTDWEEGERVLAQATGVREHQTYSDPVLNGVISVFAEKYHLPVEIVRSYFEGMGNEDLHQAQQAYYAIRRAYKVNLKTDLGEAYKLSAFSKNFAELKNELYNVFGDVDALRDREVQKTQEYHNMMDAARREAEKRVQAEYERLQPYRDMSDSELDELYMQTLPHEALELHPVSEKQAAVDALGDDQKALLSDLLTVMQERRGYTDTTDYQGQGTWAAPGNPGYATDEERREKALDDSSDVNIEDIAKGITPQPEDYFSNLRAYGHDTKQGTESARAIHDAIETIQNAGEVPMVRVYRAVPKDIEEGMFRNGDWVTMSPEYAKIHGELRFGVDNYRVIRHDVPANQLWWDGNDINEWGFDDGKDYRYKNILNNRKSNDLVTFDDRGVVIPLSNRFDERKADIRFFRSGEHQAYGFVYNGTIYIDPRIATAETPLHEYTHLWAEVLRQRNPQEWQIIVQMMKDTPEVWNYVKQNYPHLKTDDQIADEALAQFSGKRGYQKLQEFVNGQEDKSILDKMMEVLGKFWSHVAEFFGIHYTNKEEVADRIFYDLLNEVNPLDYRITAPTVNVENPDVLGENPFARIAADKAFYENFFREQQDGNELSFTLTEFVNEQRAKNNQHFIKDRNQLSDDEKEVQQKAWRAVFKSLSESNISSDPRRRANAPVNTYSASKPIVDANIGKISRIYDQLNELLREINKKDFSREQFANILAGSLGLRLDKDKVSRYTDEPITLRNGEKVSLRISNHPAISVNFIRWNNNENTAYGFVFRDGTVKGSFRNDNKVDYLEIDYHKDSIDNATANSRRDFYRDIINGIKFMLEEGSLEMMPFPDHLNASGIFKKPLEQWRKEHPEMLFHEEQQTKSNNFKEWFGDWEKSRLLSQVDLEKMQEAFDEIKANLPKVSREAREVYDDFAFDMVSKYCFDWLEKLTDEEREEEHNLLDYREKYDLNENDINELAFEELQKRFSSNITEVVSHSNGQLYTLYEPEELETSKVVDEAGRPLVVEHGTRADFTSFDMSHIGENSKDNGLFGAGFYFGTKAPAWLDDNKGSIKRAIKLHEVPELRDIFAKAEPTKEDVAALSRWLKAHKDDSIVLYHGTDSSLPILQEGLKRTSMRTKRSLQSGTGNVYLTPYPGFAKAFGGYAYPEHEDSITVYDVAVKVKDLHADKDQLKNKRMAGIDLGDSLAASMLVGHSATVKHNIENYDLQPHNTYHVMRVYLDIKRPFEITDSVKDIYTEIKEKLDTPAMRDLMLTGMSGKQIKVGEYIDVIKAVDDLIESNPVYVNGQIVHDEELQSYHPKDRLQMWREHEISRISGMGTLPMSWQVVISEQIGSHQFTAAAKQDGYDGVIVDRGEGYKEYVVFESSQVKSANMNIGTFRKESKDIRFQYVEQNEEPSKPRRLTAEDREAGGALVEQLEKMGIGVHTDNRENRRVLKAAEKDQSEAGKVRHMKTQSGESYGFAYKGEIYLDPRKIDAELPLHEYAHLWCQAFRRINPDGWKTLVNDFLADHYESWWTVSMQEQYKDLKGRDEIFEEMIANYSGKRGAERLQAELKRMTPRDADYKGRWGNIFQNISKVIQDFWKHVGDSFNIEYKNVDDIADMIMKDFAQKVSPVKKVEDWLKSRDKEYAAAVEAVDIDKARDLLWQALTECVGNGVTPFMAVDGYRGKLDRLAREIKEEGNTEAIEKAAGMMEQFVRAGAVLVPAPGHEGHATYTLELANAIGKLANVPVADVLKCAPHERQYDVKKATGTPISAEDLGIYMDGELPEDRIPVVIDNVVHSGNTAEACVKALGKGYVLSLASATSQERHVASLKRADPVAYDKKGQIIPLSERFELKNKWLGRVMNYKPIEQSPVIAGLESYSEEDIAKYVREHFEAMLEGSDIDARIIGIKVIGSRVEGNSDENSDLDVLLEFEGSHVSEDALFNILNDEEEGRLYIEGIPVDINPITASKSGTIKEFLERNKDYHKETDKNYKNDIDMKETDKKESKNVRVTLDVTGLSEESTHSVKVHGDNVNVTLADGIGKVSMEEISRLAVSFGGETRFEGDERQIIMPDLAAAEQFAGRLKYWDNVRGDTTYEGMSVDFGIRHMVFVAAGAYGITRVLPNMQPNKLAEDILKLWHGDRNILNGLTVKDYFVEVFRQLNDMDAPFHKELRQQWDDLERYSGGHLREAAWMIAYPLEDKAVDRVLAYGHDREQGFKKAPLDEKEMSLMSQYVQDQQTGNHLLGRERPEGYHDLLLEMTQTHEALWNMSLLNERQRNLLIAESMQYQGGVDELAEELNVDRDYLVAIFVDEQAAKMVKPVRGEVQVMLDDLLKQQLSIPGSSVRISHVPVRVGDEEMEAYNIENETVSDRTRYYVDVISGEGDIRVSIDVINDKESLRQLAFALQEQKILADYQKENLLDAPMFLIHPVDYEYQDAEGKTVHETLTAYSVDEGQVMLYDGMYSAGENLSSVMLSDLPLKERLSVSSEILSNLQGATFKKVEPQVTPTSERVAFMEGIFVKYDRQEAGLDAHLGDFQTMKETPDIWINGMYDYMTGEERQQFLDLVEKDDRINEFSKAAILSRRFLLNGEMDVEEFRLQQFLFKTFGGQEYELNFNIPLKLEDADERPFEANGIKMTETDGQMGFVVEIDRDKEIPLHSFGYYDDLHRRVLAELILDNITLKDARAMELLKDTLDEVNVAPAASRVRETMEGVSVSDNGMLQVHFVDEHHKMERVLSGEDLVTELDVPFLTALFDTTGKLAGIAMDAAKEEREQLKADDLAPIYMVYFEGNKDDIRYAVHGVGKESDGEYRDFMVRYQLTHPLSGMTLNEDGLVFDHISDAVFFHEDLQTLLDSPKAKEQFEAFAKSSKETYLASLLNGEGMSEDEIRSVQERITADIAAVGKAVEQQPTVIRKEPLLYSISYGTFPGLNDIAGDIHVDFGQNINAVGFREIKQMAEEMGGDARTTYEHTWADFFREADAVLFAEKIVALNQERLDAAQNDIDFRIAQMAPIYPVPATETMPVRYGIHGLVQKSEDEDYDTDLSYFINEYHAKYRDTNTYVYGYKFGFIFNDQKDALQFHSMMTDYIQAIGRDDVLFRLEYQTKKKYLYDNLIAGPTREQFDMGQFRLAEGTYMKEADGSDTQLSEREWLASVTPEEKVRFHLIGKGDKSDKQEQNTEGYYRRPVRFHFIGVKGATNLDVNFGDNNISFLQHAKNLDGLGRSAERIKLDTGWEKGTDGQWRMEIASPKSFDIYGNVQWKKEHPEILRYLELNVKATAHGFGLGDPLTDEEQKEHDLLCESEIVKSYSTGRKTMKSGRLTVQDYIDAPMLFMAYPTVKDMLVEVRSLDEGIRAQLHIEDKILSLDDGDRTYSIYLNKTLVEEAKGLSVAAKRQIFGSIAHELQHFIQETEGFALGENHEMFRDEKGAVLGDLYDATDHQLFKGGNIQTSADLKRNLEFNIGGHPLSYYYADRIKAVAEEYGFGTMESMVDGWEKLPEARKQYLYTAGEVEARNVVQRLDMTLDERRRSLAFATEDVPRVLQNVSYVHGIAFDAVRTPEETVQWLISGDETFRLQMFGRIATGIGDDNLQWAKNMEDNFLYLKEIWKSLPEDGKPSGYTLESIENWEKRMTAAEQKPLTRQEEMVRYLLTFDVDHRAMLLGRMRSDVEYYLNNGPAYGYSDGNLWAGNFEDHLTYMKALYESLPEHRQPENLTIEKIEGYRSKFNMRPPLKDGIYKVDIKLRKEDVGYAMAGWFGSLTLARPSIQEIEVRDGRVQAFRGDYGLGQAPGILGVNDLSKEGAESLYDSVRNQNVHEKSVMGIVMERMKEAGIEIYADKGLAYSQMILSKENRYLLMSGGGAYGIVRPDGTIFIDTDKATAETPIHEYTHLWAEVLRQKDPEEWKAIVKMMRDTPQWQEVRQKYPHLQMSDDIAEEALAHYSGARGHERLMASFGLKEDQGYEQLNDEQKGIFTRISEALARFWERVMTLMQVPHYISKEQVADQILFDLMNRVNPLKMKGAPAASLSNGIIRPHFIGEQGAKNITMTSRSFLLDLLQFAKDSADKGMDPAKIKLVSGWEQGTDGKWRYEVGNTKVKNMEIKDGTTLGVVVDAPEIFRAYPELKDINVILGAISDNAHYNNDTKTITLNEFYTKREVTKEQIMRIQAVNEREIADSEKKIATGEDVDAQQRRLQELLNTRAVLNGQIVSSRSISDIWPDINKVIDHEVQHAIQHIEGFAVGGSLRTVADMRLAKAEALMAQYEDVYNEYKELEYRFMNEEDHEMVMDYYDAKVKFEREHGAEINAYVVARLQRDKAEMDIVSGMLNENNFEEYRRLAGEVEARNVSERRGMSVIERRHSLASSTEDISREEQIIVDSSKESVAASIERQLSSENIPYTAGQSAVVKEGIISSLTEHNGMYLNVEGMDIVALVSAYEIQDRTSALTAAREVSTNLLHSAEEKEAGILERLLPVGMTLEQEAERMAGEAVLVGEQLYDYRKNNLRQMIDDRISGLNGLVEKANDLARKEDSEYVMKKHITGYDLSVKSENVVMLAALMGDDQKFVTSWTDSRSILDKLDSIEKEIIQRYPGLAELAASHEVRLPEEKEGVSDNLVVLSSIDDIENRPMDKNQSSQGVTTSAFSVKDEEVPGYSPAAYGSSAEVWENSMNNLVRLTVRTIKDLYNPSAYSESYDSLRDLLWGNPNDSVSTPIVDRLRGNDISGVFTTNEFYNTFEHWCKYYGSSENHTSSYGQLRDNDDFMKDLLNKVEQRFVDEYGLKVAAKEEKQKNKVVLHKIEGIDTHPMEKIVVTMLNLPEQRITVDLYGYDGSVHGLDVTGGVIQGGVLTFADGSTTDLDYMIGTTLESQLGKTLADQIESMDMSDTVEHPIVDKGAAIWDFYAEQIGLGLDSELRDKLNVLIPESGNRLVLNVPISTTLLGKEFGERIIVGFVNNNGYFSAQTDKGESADIDRLVISGLVASHKQIDGQHYTCEVKESEKKGENQEVCFPKDIHILRNDLEVALNKFADKQGANIPISNRVWEGQYNSWSDVEKVAALAVEDVLRAVGKGDSNLENSSSSQYVSQQAEQYAREITEGVKAGIAVARSTEKYFAFGQEVPQETIDELRADGVTDFSTENLEKLLHFEAQDNDVPTEDVDFREGMSERVWQKLNEILPENGDKIVLSEPFTITKAEGYAVDRAQEVKEIVRAMSPEYDTDVFICGDELGGINTFRMVYDDLARVENILDGEKYTVELQEKSARNDEYREERGYLMDVISEALHDMNGHVEIPHTELPSIPLKGEWSGEGDGHAYMEIITGEHNISDAVFHDVHAETYPIDEVVGKLGSSEIYELTVAVRKAQIANFVGAGDEISFVNGLPVSRDEPGTLKDFVDMVKFDKEGNLQIIGYRLDDEGNHISLDEVGGLELSGYNELYASVKEIREQERLDDIEQEAVEEKPAEVVNAPKDETQEKKSAEKEATKKDLSKRHEAYKDYRIPEGLLIDKGNVFKLDSGKDAGKYAVYALVNGKKHFTPMEPDNKEHMKDLSYFFACVKNGERNTALNNLLAKYIGEKRQNVAIHEEKPKEKDKPVPAVERQRNLLAYALGEALKDGILANRRMMVAPSLLGSDKPVSGFNMLLMALHAQAKDYVTSQYVEYKSATAMGFSVSHNQQALPFDWYNWNKFVNKTNEHDIIDEAKYKSLDKEEQGLYEAMRNKRVLNVFNLGQTNYAAVKKEDYEKAVSGQSDAIIFKPIGKKGAVEEGMQTLLSAVKGAYPDHLVLMKKDEGYALYGSDAIRGGDILQKDVVLSKTRFDEDGDAVNEILITAEELPEVIDKLSEVANVTLCEKEDCQVSSKLYERIDAIYAEMDHIGKALESADGNHVMVNPTLETDYNRETDNLIINNDRQGVVGMEYETAVARLNEAYRQIAAYVGSAQRLDREASQNLLPADAAEYDRLVQELSAAVLMVRQGLPATVSEVNKPLLEYWKRELKETPSIVAQLENDIDNTVGVVDKIRKGEDVNYTAIRGRDRFVMDAGNTYSITQDLNTRPSEQDRSVVVIRHDSSHVADVILPRGASKEVSNEADGMRKNSIILALHKEGYGQVRFYNAGGSLSLKEANDYYRDRKVDVCTLAGTTLIVKENVDLAEKLAESSKVRILFADMIKAGEKSYALYIKPENQDSIVVFPDPRDITRFFSVAEHDRDRLDGVRQSLGRKYYNIVQKHPEFKADILMPKEVDVDMKRLSNVNIRKDRQTQGWMLFADIDHVHQKPLPIDQIQAQHFWLVDDKEMYKLRLAASMFQEKLGLGEGRDSAQFRTSEEGRGSGSVSEPSKEGGKDHLNEEEVRTGIRLK